MADNKNVPDLNLKISKKIDDKWLTFGSVKKNQWGNLSMSIRVTALFKKMVAETEESGWINFALFEDKEK